MSKLLRAAMVVSALGLTSSAFGSIMLSFKNITGNSATNAAIGETQLSVTVSNPGAGQVDFRFDNIGLGQSSITQVYFHDGSLLGIANVINGPGVSFTQGANPPDLPGGNSVTPAFQTTAGFLAESTNPPPMRGVNNTATGTEWLTIRFNLQGSQNYNDVLAELTDGRLRIGMHVIHFANGGSESFVNNPLPVPAPAAVVLGMMGLGAIPGLRRRFS